MPPAPSGYWVKSGPKTRTRLPDEITRLSRVLDLRAPDKENTTMEYPDKTDLQIIQELRASPRITNKRIARQLDIAESTVAQRIRGMAERGIMKVVAQKHLFSDGYEFLCFLFVNTSRRKVQAICNDIANEKQVYSVSQGVGNPDVFVMLRAKSIKSAHDLVDRIGQIKGVDTVDFCTCIHMHKYVSALGDLNAPNSMVDKEEESIFLPLSQDGRQSNREVARKLDVSEGTVRQRINKLAQSGVMQFEVVCNPAALRLTVNATARITTLTRQTDKVIRELKKLDSVALLAEVTGGTNILAHLNASSTQELGDLCDNTIPAIGGIHSMQVQLVVSAAKHQYHYAYFDSVKELPRRK